MLNSISAGSAEPVTATSSSICVTRTKLIILASSNFQVWSSFPHSNDAAPLHGVSLYMIQSLPSFSQTLWLKEKYLALMTMDVIIDVRRLFSSLKMGMKKGDNDCVGVTVHLFLSWLVLPLT